MQLEDFPYLIVALGPFSPVPEENHTPRLVPVDLSAMDEAMADLSPVLRLEVPKSLCPDGWITVAPKSLRDLRPQGLLECSPYLKQLNSARKAVEQGIASGQPPEAMAGALKQQFGDLPLDLQLEASGSSAPDAGSSAVDDILSMVASSAESSPAPGSGGPSTWKAQAESLIASLLRCVYDSPVFKTFESAWRGVEQLCKQGNVKEGGRVRLLIGSISPDGMADAQESLLPVLAEHLPQLVLLDLAFDSTPKQIEELKAVAGLGDSLLAPVAVQLTPRFFHLETWDELTKVQYLKHFLEDAAFAKWRKLQQDPESNWLITMVNPFLSRAAYGADNKPKSPYFSEAEPLWTSPAYALGALVARSVAEHGWPCRFTDYATVRLENLPVAGVKGAGNMATQSAVSEDRIHEFVECGITPLVGALYKDIALIPREATAAGAAVRGQLFLNQVLGFFFWCKEHLDGPISQGDIGQNLSQTFEMFWELTGQPAPRDLEISPVGQAENGIPLRIAFTPPHSVLAGANRIEFTFTW